MATIEFLQAPQRISTVFMTKEETGANPGRGLFEYKPFAGKEGSSPDNFVPVDWALSRLVDLLHISDDDLKKK